MINGIEVYQQKPNYYFK